MTPISLSWLRSFVAVAQQGERKAAESLGIRQSTVHKHIVSLGGWLQGPALFEGRPQRLTEKGQAFLPAAQAAIPLMEQALAMLAEHRESPDGAILISEVQKISPLNVKVK
ncbi:MAG: LysR family transcriptional regulator [Novosphingobium sp.]|nr:LysR family transcriptional regulator [Novosphingobium sp.]